MYFAMKKNERYLLEQLFAAFEYLWPAGLLLFLLHNAYYSSANEFSSDKISFFCAGIIFPLCAFIIYLSEHVNSLFWILKGLKLWLILYSLNAFRNYWFEESSFTLFLCIPIVSLLIGLVHWYHHKKNLSISQGCITLFLVFFISLPCWFAAQNMIIMETCFIKWASTSWYVLPVLVCCSCLVAWVFFSPKMEDTNTPKQWIKHSFALLLFALLSFQTDSLFDYRVYTNWGFSHHWAFWVGPAESVRDGGWLLWNVPSQYGFLNILTIAMLPFTDVWQSMFILQSSFLLIISGMLYYFFIQWGKHFTNYLFAVLFTVSLVFFYPGPVTDVLAGGQPWPDVGPLRYFWLIASVWISWFFLGRKTPHVRCYLYFGSICWVIGILWSFESAAFCSTIFFAVLGVLLLQQISANTRKRFLFLESARLALPFFLIPATMLIFAISCIWIYYKINLGTGPDWLGYYEYALLHAGKKSMPLPLAHISAQSPIFIVILCVLASITLWKFKEHPQSPQSAMTLGIFYAFWVSLLLYVVMKHPLFMDCGHIFGLAIGILLPILDTLSHPLLSKLSRYALLPIIAFYMTNTFASPDLYRVVRSIHLPDTQLIKNMPPMEPSACLLLDWAHITGKESLACDYHGYTLPPPRHRDVMNKRIYNNHSWLPKPLVMFMVLPEKRQMQYIARNIRQHSQEKWLLMERPKINRANNVSRIRYPYIPKVIRRLLTMPVSHWNDEVCSNICRWTTARELYRKPTLAKGQLLLAKLRVMYSVQPTFQNEHWSLYRCIPKHPVN